MSQRFILRPTLRGMAAATLFSATTAVYAQAPAAPVLTVAAAEALFKEADANGDGKLSRVEAATLPEALKSFDAWDKDQDGFLSLTEFVNGMVPLK